MYSALAAARYSVKGLGGKRDLIARKRDFFLAALLPERVGDAVSRDCAALDLLVQ